MIWIVELLNIQNQSLICLIKKTNKLKEVSRILTLFFGSLSNALVPFGVRPFTCESSIILSAQMPLN